ncbi:hypothetical protein BJY59DRAFT_355162 [Rhodotorula toruloides]
MNHLEETTRDPVAAPATLYRRPSARSRTARSSAWSRFLRVHPSWLPCYPRHIGQRGRTRLLCLDHDRRAVGRTRQGEGPADQGRQRRGTPRFSGAGFRAPSSHVETLSTDRACDPQIALEVVQNQHILAFLFSLARLPSGSLMYAGRRE